MKILREWKSINKINEEIVLNIGNFDGVHIGHQSLINKGKDLAIKEKAKLAVLTFNPHPKSFFAPNDFKRITTKDEMKDIFESLGVKIWLDLPFNSHIAKLSPAEFMRKLTRDLKLKHVVVGFNFKFGYQASGNVNYLKEYLLDKNIELSIHEPVTYKGEKVSSTLIRQLIEDGNIKKARLLMERDYCLEGIVVHGKGRGKNLGFPTANIRLNEKKIVPKNGVYAGYTENGYNLAVNIGYKPTFSDNNITIEAHLLDYEGTSLYGNKLKIYLSDFIREEKKFSNLNELKEQIKKDVGFIKELNPAELFTSNK